MKKICRRVGARFAGQATPTAVNFEITAVAFERECEQSVTSIPADQREKYHVAAEAVCGLAREEKEYPLYLILSASLTVRRLGVLDLELVAALSNNAFAADVDLPHADVKASALAQPAEGTDLQLVCAAPPVAKKTCDAELVSFDAPRKITVIEEVKALLGLGFKEAKELVEKGTITLKTNVLTAEAETLRDKLIAAGCSVNLK